MDNKSKDFLKLQREWDAKLAESGFEDIEQRRNDQRDGECREDKLKLWSSSFYGLHDNELLRDAQESYYRLAGQFLYDYPFKDKHDRLVWELHAGGMSRRNILKELKRRKVKTYTSKVQYAIERLAKEMMKKCKN